MQTSNTFIIRCLILFISIGCISCGKKHDVTTPVTPPTDSTSTKTVYVAGTVGSGNDRHAVYWKNDSLINLPGANSAPESITILGNDIYISGFVNDTMGYWKNNVFVPLFKASQAGYGIIVGISGSDVYASGNSFSNGHYVAEYWKNGTEIKLDGDTINTAANSLAISGSDVYVVGYSKSTGMAARVTYWKNNSPVYVTDGSTDAFANAIAVSGTDVYIAGVQADATESHFIPTIWKNGIAVSLSDTSYTGALFALTVSGNDVYAGGFEKKGSNSSQGNSVATYWKNGVGHSLATNMGYGTIYSIAIDGSDEYLVYDGDYAGYYSVATYKKNGVTKQLSDGTADADARVIFIKK